MIELVWRQCRIFMKVTFPPILMRHLTLTAGYRISRIPIHVSTFCRSHEPLFHFGHCARCYRKLPLRKEEAPKVMTLILLHGSIAEKSPNVPTHFLFIITADRLCDTIELPRSHPLRWHRSILSHRKRRFTFESQWWCCLGYTQENCLTLGRSVICGVQTQESRIEKMAIALETVAYH